MKNILICILTCFSSLWTQPPYNDRNSLLFLIPPKLKQSQLSSHFDFGVNNQRSLSPSIPQLRWDPWERHQTLNCSPGAAAIWLPTAPGVCSSRCVCVFTAVCVCTLDGLNAEHKFWVLATHLFTFAFINLCLAAQIILLQTVFWMRDNSRQVLLKSWNSRMITSTEERGGVSCDHRM